MNAKMPDSVLNCSICGSGSFTFQSVLWDGLVDEWGLSDIERAYIDRQQGVQCAMCQSSMRSIALASSIMRWLKYTGRFKDMVRSYWFRRLRILEINEAGSLTGYLSPSRRHTIAKYPEHDMTRLIFKDNTFDLVIHSDTLEHVPDPLLGLSECMRVLKNNGACCFTVPLITGRMSRSRTGLPVSYHGGELDCADDYAVHTEFGADAWTLPLRAGFSECRILTVEYPAAQAFTCAK